MLFMASKGFSYKEAEQSTLAQYYKLLGLHNIQELRKGYPSEKTES